MNYKITVSIGKGKKTLFWDYKFNIKNGVIISLLKIRGIKDKANGFYLIDHKALYNCKSTGFKTSEKKPLLLDIELVEPSANGFVVSYVHDGFKVFHILTSIDNFLTYAKTKFRITGYNDLVDQPNEK